MGSVNHDQREFTPTVRSNRSPQSIYSNNVVYNEDDCVALTSGQNVLFENYYCNGGHGMSIGSVGGKSNNTVSQITFMNSFIVNSQNGPRIKANSGTSGTVDQVTYQNIQVSNISVYGLDVQQDYRGSRGHRSRQG